MICALKRTKNKKYTVEQFKHANKIAKKSFKCLDILKSKKYCIVLYCIVLYCIVLYCKKYCMKTRFRFKVMGYLL